MFAGCERLKELFPEEGEVHFGKMYFAKLESKEKGLHTGIDVFRDFNSAAQAQTQHYYFRCT